MIIYTAYKDYIWIFPFSINTECVFAFKNARGKANEWGEGEMKHTKTQRIKFLKKLIFSKANLNTVLLEHCVMHVTLQKSQAKSLTHVYIKKQ